MSSRDGFLLCEGREGVWDRDGVGGKSCIDLDFVIGLGIRPFIKAEERVSEDFLGLLPFRCIDGAVGKGGGSSVAYERSPKLPSPADDW